MPTYEYVCKACDHEFEKEQRINDAPLKTCPRCKAKQVKRLISRTSFHLKGGGWYSDLYSSSKKGSKKDGDSKPAAESSAKSDAGSTSGTGTGSGSGSGSGGSDGGSGSKAAAA
jgi:putative FmdB family regulatory protein